MFKLKDFIIYVEIFAYFEMNACNSNVDEPVLAFNQWPAPKVLKH